MSRGDRRVQDSGRLAYFTGLIRYFKRVQDEGTPTSTKIHDLSESALVFAAQTQSVTAVTTATVATTGATKDFVSADGECTLLLQTGTVSGTSPTASVSVQESTDGTTWTGIGGTLVGISAFPLSATSTNSSTACGFERTKRYLQTITTTSGTTAVMPVGVTIIEQKKLLN